MILGPYLWYFDFVSPSSKSWLGAWLFNAVYFSQLGCCNPEISQFFQEKSRYQLCHFSSPIELDSSKLPHAAKSGTICISTCLGKIAISPDCNIQLGWNKRHSKAKSLFVIVKVIYRVAPIKRPYPNKRPSPFFKQNVFKSSKIRKQDIG